MIKEAKELSRSGAVQIAIAIVLAQSFISVVTSFVDNIILPIMGVVIGGRSFASLFVNLTPEKRVPSGPIDSIEKAHYAGAAIIAYGAFFITLIQFSMVLLAGRQVLRWLSQHSVEPAKTPAPDSDA